MRNMREQVLHGYRSMSTLMSLCGQRRLFVEYTEWPVAGPPRNNAQWFIYMMVTIENSLKFDGLVS